MRADPGQAGGKRQFKCPNCGSTLAINEQCRCNNPVKFITMVGCKQNYLAYIDKTGNIRRVRE